MAHEHYVIVVQESLAEKFKRPLPLIPRTRFPKHLLFTRRRIGNRFVTVNIVYI